MSVYEHKGQYFYQDVWGDLDETEGTLKELREWVDEMIKEHGEGAKFEIDHPLDEGGRASYRLTRGAKPDEIEGYKQRQLKAKQEAEARERAEFEKLKAKFGA